MSVSFLPILRSSFPLVGRTVTGGLPLRTQISFQVLNNQRSIMHGVMSMCSHSVRHVSTSSISLNKWRPRGGQKPVRGQQSAPIQPQWHDAHQQQQQQQGGQQQVPPLQPPLSLLYIVGGYLGIVNIAAFGLFWHDKQQALTGGWRVPEKTLQLTALLGGWIAGLYAMKAFRHKTVKKSFKEPYALMMGTNMLISAGLVGAWIFSAPTRAAILRSAKSLRLP